jgi:hypothetical protein
VAQRRTGARRGTPGFEEEERLVEFAGSAGDIEEPGRLSDRLRESDQDVDFGSLQEPGQRVGHVHVAFVSGAEDVRYRQVDTSGELEEGQAVGTALAGQSNRPVGSGQAGQ